MTRFRALPPLALLALFAAGGSTSAQPQGPPSPPPTQQEERSRNLDMLFGALKVAPDAASAKAVEDRIWALWFVSGSDTADLLMSRAKAAMEGQDLDLALQLLDAVVKIKPDYAEAWNRRATIYYSKKDFGHALSDLAQTLRLEPRHFGALSGLGMMLQEIGEEKRALEVFRRALAINPHLPRIPDLVRTLTEKLEGEEI